MANIIGIDSSTKCTALCWMLDDGSIENMWAQNNVDRELIESITQVNCIAIESPVVLEVLPKYARLKCSSRCRREPGHRCCKPTALSIQARLWQHNNALVASICKLRVCETQHNSITWVPCSVARTVCGFSRVRVCETQHNKGCEIKAYLWQQVCEQPEKYKWLVMGLAEHKRSYPLQWSMYKGDLIDAAIVARAQWLLQNMSASAVSQTAEELAVLRARVVQEDIDSWRTFAWEGEVPPQSISNTTLPLVWDAHDTTSYFYRVGEWAYGKVEL